MRFSTVDNEYLNKAIERISSGYEAITHIPVMLNPMPDFYEQATDSYWAVGAVLMADSDQADDMGTQLWSVASQLMWHPQQVRERTYDATIYSAMYGLVPKAFNYMKAHRNLVFEEGQAGLHYLNPSQVRVVLNSINLNGQPGFAIVHRLPFRITIDQEYE